MTAAAAPSRAGVGRSLARAAVAIAAVTVLSRLVGLLRVFVLARTVGEDPVLADTYQAANTLPNIVFEIVAGGALAAVVVPALARAAEDDDGDTVRRATGGLLTWAVVALTPLALAGMLLGRPLMELLTGDVPEAARRATQVDVGARMLVVFMPQVVLYGLGIVLTGVLQAHRRFVWPAVAPLLSSGAAIATYLLYAAIAQDGGITRPEQYVLAGGTTVAVAVLSLSLVRPALRTTGRLRPSLTLPPGIGAQVRRLAGYAAAGVAAQQLVLALVLRLAAPQLGGVFAYSVGYTVFLLPWAVLAVPLATSAFPELARAAARGDDQAYAGTAAASLRAVVLASGLGAAALVAVAPAAARLVLGVNDGGVPVSALADAIAGLAPGLVGYGVLAVLTRALYARDDGRGPAIATVTGFAVVALVDVVAVRSVTSADRVGALAMGHSVGMTVAGVLLVVLLRRSAGATAVVGIARAATCVVVGTTLAAVSGRWAADRLTGTSVSVDLARGVVGVTCVLLVYTAVAVTAGQADLRAVGRRVGRRRG